MIVSLGFGIVVVLGVVSALMVRSFGQARLADGASLDVAAQRRRDLRSYVYGLGLALALTAVPFGVVYWSALPHFWLPITIGVLAVIQVVVHFRFFLHVDPHDKEHLHLVLFTVVILTMMGGGTMWLLANLFARMH